MAKETITGDAEWQTMTGKENDNSECKCTAWLLLLSVLLACVCHHARRILLWVQWWHNNYNNC
jgi:hypothetical protein